MELSPATGDFRPYGIRTACPSVCGNSARSGILKRTPNSAPITSDGLNAEGTARLGVWGRESRKACWFGCEKDSRRRIPARIVSDRDTTGPTGTAMLTIMAAFAQMERDTMIELTRAGLAAAAANNRHGRRARKVEDAAAARARTSKVKRSVPRTLEISLESPSLLSTGTFSRRAGRQSLRARRRSHLFHMRDSWVIPTGLLRRLSRCRRIVRSGR